MWLTLSRQLPSRNKSPISTILATCVLPVCQLVILWLSLVVSSAWCRVHPIVSGQNKKAGEGRVYTCGILAFSPFLSGAFCETHVR